MRRETLNQQLEAQAINSDVAREFRNDRRAMKAELAELLANADKEFSHAAAMHFEGKCSYWQGYRAALKAVNKII